MKTDIYMYPWRDYAGQVTSVRRNGALRHRAYDVEGKHLGTFEAYSDAKETVQDSWRKAHGNPRLLVTEKGTDRLVWPGDTVTDFRGNVGTFNGVSDRGRTGTWKVTVDGREYYHTVFNLIVTEVRDNADQ